MFLIILILMKILEALIISLNEQIEKGTKKV